jgi:hypothetical protein
MPSEWRTDPDRVREWVDRSLAWAEQLPPKQAKKKRS